MAPSLSVDVIREPILQTLLVLVADPIPNIRFNVAKSLEVVATTLSQSAEGQALSEDRIVPSLRGLLNDPDADVRYFATRALEKTLGGANVTGESYFLLFYGQT